MNSRAFVLLAALVAAAGCADNDASVSFRGVCAYNEDCSFSGTCDAYLLGAPAVDLDAANGLEVFAEVANQLQDNTDETTGHTNTNDARIEEIDVSYDSVATFGDHDGDPATPDQAYTLAIPGASITVQNTIPAAGTGVILVYPVVPGSASIDKLKTAAGTAGTHVVAKVVAKGHYLDGTRFETGAYKIPIDVCVGCAASITGGCSGTTTASAYCPQYGQTSVAVCE